MSAGQPSSWFCVIASNDYIADYYESIGMSMTLGAGYSFELLGKSLRAGFSFPFRVALQDEVNSNPSRRFSPFDSNLSLSAGSLFKDEDITGINVSVILVGTAYLLREHQHPQEVGWPFNWSYLSRTWGGFNVSVSSSYFRLPQFEGSSCSYRDLSGERPRDC